ncbi:MAG: RecQ family ATP-dependent DNA helicase, partial [Balneolaceae bacterium]|nr:RecQ family ATP-dependent DNA helicase [Balneolaceae bacterium]
MSSDSFQKAQQNLQKYWGYDSFREGQDQAIQSVLDGNNTVVLFPTGGGKSLCYQVPATVFEGITLVISPLVALMQDQVQQLNERNVPATFINSTISSWEVEQRLVNARNGMYKLLYCAPERLKTALWEAELPNLNIDLVAIDEAHCISEWGHDFRPSYRDIRPSLESITDSVCWIALTATATPEVREDIITNLQFDDPVVVSKGFQRPNLKWWVLEGAQKDQNLMRSVKKASAEGAGIIYGGTRRNCERLADLIQKRLGVKTAAYHAGVESRDRKLIQENWISGKTPLVVATNAFGMGIDKADCRYVIHYEMPYSLEAYYQQAGRAGRDGVESYPLLLFKEADVHKAKRRIEDSYPNREQLQNVYDAICDNLNLAVGSLEEEMREVSIPAIKKRTHLSSSIVRASLKTLKHLGIIELADYVVPQVGVQFIVNPDYLREQIKSLKNSEKAEFLDTLYRQFGGEAFEDIKYLELDYLKRKLDVSKNGLIKGLQVLQNHDNVLRFEAIGELPLVRPVEERVSSLRLKKSELEDHRNSLLKKLDR